MIEHPALSQFFGAYLHQDWADFAESVGEVLEEFASLADPSTVQAAIAEAGRLLEEGRSEADLRRLFRELGLDYRPEGDGMTPSGWLAYVKRELERLSA